MKNSSETHFPEGAAIIPARRNPSLQITATHFNESIAPQKIAYGSLHPLPFFPNLRPDFLINWEEGDEACARLMR